jgi:hypothetical protein
MLDNCKSLIFYLFLFREFIRVTRGPEVGAYYHPLFQKDEPEMCRKMSCMASKSRQSIEPMNPIALGLSIPTEESSDTKESSNGRNITNSPHLPRPQGSGQVDTLERQAIVAMLAAGRNQEAEAESSQTRQPSLLQQLDLGSDIRSLNFTMNQYIGEQRGGEQPVHTPSNLDLSNASLFEPRMLPQVDPSVINNVIGFPVAPQIQTQVANNSWNPSTSDVQFPMMNSTSLLGGQEVVPNQIMRMDQPMNFQQMDSQDLTRIYTQRSPMPMISSSNDVIAQSQDWGTGNHGGRHDIRRSQQQRQQQMGDNMGTSASIQQYPPNLAATMEAFQRLANSKKK